MGVFDKLLGVHPAMNQQAATQEDLAWNSLSQQQQENYQNYQNMANAGISSTIGAGAFVRPKSTKPNPDTEPLYRMTMTDLNGEAATTSLENLSNLWQARWRSQWVRRSEIDGEFYNIAATRLNAAHMLEVHQLADGTQVYRLIERF